MSNAVYVIARGSKKDGTREYATAQSDSFRCREWSGDIRMAERYPCKQDIKGVWSPAFGGAKCVKLRVKAAPAPDAHDILYRLAGIEADGVGVILGWPDAGPADETLTGAARRVVAERDALKAGVGRGDADLAPYVAKVKAILRALSTESCVDAAIAAVKREDDLGVRLGAALNERDALKAAQALHDAHEASAFGQARDRRRTARTTGALGDCSRTPNSDKPLRIVLRDIPVALFTALTSRTSPS